MKFRPKKKSMKMKYWRMNTILTLVGAEKTPKNVWEMN